MRNNNDSTKQDNAAQEAKPQAAQPPISAQVESAQDLSHRARVMLQIYGANGARKGPTP